MLVSVLVRSEKRALQVDLILWIHVLAEMLHPSEHSKGGAIYHDLL
jgi:hypothetical protein